MQQKRNLGALEGICEFHLRYFRGSQFKGSRIPKMAANFNLLLKRDQVHGWLVCYTAVFSVITQRSSPQAASENRTTFLSLCVYGLANKPIMYKRFDYTWAARRLVCYTAVFSVVTQLSSLLRDNSKNGCVAD